MTPILKDPGAVLRYVVAWPASLLDGASIAAAGWTIEPDEPGGLAASAHFVEGGETGAEFAGGVPGRVYRAACAVTLSDGRADERSILVRVEQR